MREVEEKLEKYQRTDVARVLQQASPSPRGSRTEDASSSRHSVPTDFRPDELPDGAFVSPKHAPARALLPPEITASLAVSRPAEYTGSFTVGGADDKTRADQVERQLETLRSVQKGKRVLVAISLLGVKVFSKDGQTMYMNHDLKRISYATCDPEHCQFSFLARERQMNVLYCHAFLTQTPGEAEELNTLIGNAFKMAYAQERDRKPTFHELIEAQVLEQRAKFIEIEKQAQVELQLKLAEIARPTPFSEKAQQRMEMRRQGPEERDTPVLLPTHSIGAENKLWAKQAVEKVQHRISMKERPGSFTGTGVDPIFSRHSDPQIVPLDSKSRGQTTSGKDWNKSHAHKNVTKHNSAPLFPAQVTSPSDEPPAQGEDVSCVIPHHPLSAQAIRVSIETKKDSKVKGSPVTALKNEIDRRFLSNGSETAPLEAASAAASSSSCLQGVERETDQKAIRQEHVRHQIHMASRPLPNVPATSISGPGQANSNNNNSSKPSPRQRPTSSYHWRSFDDHSFLPSSSSSPAPLSSPKQSNGVAIRNSPRRKQPRPLSEIATGSSGAGSKGYDNWNLPSFSQGAAAPSSSSVSPFQSPQHHARSSQGLPSSTSQPLSAAGDAGLYIYGPTPGSVMAELRAGGKGPRFESSPKHDGPERSPQRGNGQERGPALSRGSSCPSGNTEPVLRYQNDSPFHVEDPDAVGKARQGLESLMCLDRSHIEDPALRQAPWYQAGIPREIALEILQQEDVGSFIVRDSTTHPGCFALSVRVPKFENTSGITHYLILKTQRGVKLKGLDKEWPTLTALVTHHTVMPEMLPCTLRLPRNNKNLTFREAEREDPDDDASYQRLTDVTTMAGQLKL